MFVSADVSHDYYNRVQSILTGDGIIVREKYDLLITNSF